MLNAAVSVEAYDPDGGVTDETKAAMTPTAWRPYPDRVHSSHWYELFLDTPNDARQGLTWKGLFKDVDNTINFYSSADEVGPMTVDREMFVDTMMFNPTPNDPNLTLSMIRGTIW